MKILGIIAEYNPFHNGHAHHIAKARRASGCDCVVAVMSGSVVQRGEWACADKWVRTRAALMCGVDAVIELPVSFASAPAERFAVGGVALLAGVGAEAISFGCEIEDIDLLLRLADIRVNEPVELSELIRENLRKGKSHPRARGEALERWAGIPAEIACAPNAALAVEYLCAIRRLSIEMDVYPVLRTVGHHDGGLGAHSSATAIRAALEAGDMRGARLAMPPAASEILFEHWPERSADPARLDALVVDRIRGMSAEELDGLPGADEGLARRLGKLSAAAADVDDLVERAKCKRYTRARIRRMIMHAALGVTRRHIEEHHLPAYARVLGFRRGAGERLMGQMPASSGLPLITDAQRLRGQAEFGLELRATDLYSLASRGAVYRRSGRDYTEPMVVVG